MRRLLLAHGWGWDATMWDAVLDRLPGVSVRRIEHGYLGAPPGSARSTPDTVLVGHSAGLCDLLELAGEGCAAVVAINGFSRFAGAPDFPDGIAPRVLERMVRRLDQDAPGTVAAFRARCRDKQNSVAPDPIDAPRLRAGLDRLARADGRHALDRLRAAGTRIVALAGTRDPVAPAGLATACFAPNEIAWHAAPGHMLPLDAPDWCAACLRDVAA